MGNYTTTNNSFIFSLKHHTKHKVKTGNANSMYCNSSYGPTFGGGHDLYISNDGNSS